jgi:hypothetical protein
LAGNPVKPLLSLYGTEWRERGYGLRCLVMGFALIRAVMFKHKM